jgi:hypothetical protein
MKDKKKYFIVGSIIIIGAIIYISEALMGWSLLHK